MSDKIFPRRQVHLCRDQDGVIDCGLFQPTESLDIQQINVGCYLKGDFSDKKIVITVQDTQKPARVFTSTNHNLPFVGHNTGYASFMFESFYVTGLDTYNVKVELKLKLDSSNVIDPDTELFVISDWIPEINAETKQGFISPAKIEIYGR